MLSRHRACCCHLAVTWLCFAGSVPMGELEALLKALTATAHLRRSTTALIQLTQVWGTSTCLATSAALNSHCPRSQACLHYRDWSVSWSSHCSVGDMQDSTCEGFDTLMLYTLPPCLP